MPDQRPRLLHLLGLTGMILLCIGILLVCSIAEEGSGNGNGGWQSLLALPTTRKMKRENTVGLSIQQLPLVADYLTVPSPLVQAIPSLDTYPEERRYVFTSSICRVSGIGFKGTSGDLTHLTIELIDNENGTAAELWNESVYIYLTLESPDMVYSAWAKINESRSGRLDFKLPSPGTYTWAVDLLGKQGAYPLLDKRGWKIQVEAPANATADGTVFQASERCTDVDDAGVWFKCTSKTLDHPRECLRWGYTFRPHTGCHYENWKHQDLVAYATAEDRPKQWILVLGSSVIRGVFLSAVDHLVNGRRGEFDGISKCWGRLDVEVGDIRLTYQDFRAPVYTPFPVPTEPGQNGQCHDDRLASQDSYTLYQNATKFITNIFADPIRRPTAIVYEHDMRSGPEIIRAIIIDQLPEDWGGKVFGVYLRDFVHGNILGPISIAEKERVRTIIGFPVQLIDTHDIIMPWMRMQEAGIAGISQHWHSVKPDHAYDFAVNGIVTDAVAQQMFHHVLGPKPKIDLSFVHAMTVAIPGVAHFPLQVCMDCPAGLLPFNIKPQAELICYDHLPQKDYKHQYVASSPPCPAWCMQIQSNTTLQTQSGPVTVRECRKS